MHLKQSPNIGNGSKHRANNNVIFIFPIKYALFSFSLLNEHLFFHFLPPSSLPAHHTAATDIEFTPLVPTRPNSPVHPPPPLHPERSPSELPRLKRRYTPGHRILIQIPKHLYLVEFTFTDRPDVSALCNQIWEIYKLRRFPIYLTFDEIDRVDILCRKLIELVDPLKIHPRPKFIIKTGCLDPRFSRILQMRLESRRLAEE